MTSRGRRQSSQRFAFVYLALVFVHAVPTLAQAADRLPEFTRQPSCEATVDSNLLRLRAEVTGAESLQWLSNNVPVPGATNLTIEFAPNLTNRTAYVLMASNTVGLAPSTLIWSDSCEESGSGVVQLFSTEPLVLDEAGSPYPEGQLKLYVGRFREGVFRFPSSARLSLHQGRIQNDPVTVRYKPGTRVYVQFTFVPDEWQIEHGRSMIFEATVGTTNAPGSLDAVLPWRWRHAECYGNPKYTVTRFEMKIGRPAQVETKFNSSSCGEIFNPTNIYWDLIDAKWLKNGVPIEDSHPILRKDQAVTMTDAGVYEFYQRDAYIGREIQRFVVAITRPGELRFARTGPDTGQLSFSGPLNGVYRLERSRDFRTWQFLIEAKYTNAPNVVGLQVPVITSGTNNYYRFK